VAKVMVCDKWELPLTEGKTGYFEWIKRPQAGKMALCKEAIIGGIKIPINSVTECFGGIGVSTIIIQNLLKPAYHCVFENDEDCYKQLKSAFENVDVQLGDALELISETQSELYMLDFEYYTVNHTQWTPLWDAIYAKNPMGVIWLDTASHYLHLHKKLYGSILDYEVASSKDYYDGFSRMIHQKYGYSIVKRISASGVNFLAAVQTDLVGEIPHEAISGNKGLVFVDDDS
jgi:hypothetical protein